MSPYLWQTEPFILILAFLVADIDIHQVKDLMRRRMLSLLRFLGWPDVIVEHRLGIQPLPFWIGTTTRRRGRGVSVVVLNKKCQCHDHVLRRTTGIDHLGVWPLRCGPVIHVVLSQIYHWCFRCEINWRLVIIDINDLTLLHRGRPTTRGQCV